MCAGKGIQGLEDDVDDEEDEEEEIEEPVSKKRRRGGGGWTYEDEEFAPDDGEMEVSLKNIFGPPSANQNLFTRAQGHI